MKPTRLLLGTLGILLAAWIIFIGYIDWAMHQTPAVFGHVMMHLPTPAYLLFPFETLWTEARHGQVNPGDTAPDFTVQTLDTKAPVQLASLWKYKPVVLVFGSYT
ncbi:MAG TPA: hypothetical protein VMU80_16980 [Bryobacteraceae bacterium]|nr:hypothetical protein [Bryobacteraceae bacterium]HUO30921.1 hypothetical protein [Bryobacteraceae bacterium]